MGQDQLDKFIQEQLGQHQSPIDTDALWKSIEAKKGEEIETIVKDKLANHESAIDSQAIWNNISVKVTGKASTTWIKTSLGILLLIGILSCLAIYYNNKTESPTVENTTLNINDNDKSIVSSSDIDPTSNDGLLNSTIAKSQIENTKNNDDIYRTIELENKDIKITENKTYDNLSSNSNRTSEPYDSDRNSQTNKSENNSNNYRGSNNPGAESGHTDRTHIDITDANTTALSQTNNQVSDGITNNNTASTYSDIIGGTDSRTHQLSQAQSISSIYNLYMTHTDNTASDYLAELPSKDECFSWNKSVECYDYSPKKLHFSILAYTTADYYRKSMSANSVLTQNYLNNRMETQSAQISNRSGLLIKLRHRKGIYIKFGAEAGFLRERFSHQTRDTITEIVPDQLINIDVDMNGDSTFTYGNAPITTISSKNWRVNNSHRTIGIPILLGYEKEMSKFSLGIELGVLYNIHRSFEGWLLGPPDAPSDAKDYFTSSNDLNLTGGFNLNYDINNRYRLVGLATFRQNMNSINNLSINEINQKNTTFGVGVGIEFKI